MGLVKKPAARVASPTATASAGAATPSLRERMKRETRKRLEDATIRMIRKHGFRAMTIDQIAQAAGATRPTFYQYFKNKADLIHFIQESRIAPEMIAICQRLDALEKPSWQDLRGWVNEYARTWGRIHVFFDAYSEASMIDPTVARTIVPNTAQVTAHMTRLFGRFRGDERRRVQGKLDLLLNLMASVMTRVHALGDDPLTSPLLDQATDILWDSLFAGLSCRRRRIT